MHDNRLLALKQTVLAWSLILGWSLLFPPIAISQEYLDYPLSAYSARAVTAETTVPHRHISDLDEVSTGQIRPASMLQPTPLVVPRPDMTASPLRGLTAPPTAATLFPISNLQTLAVANFGDKDVVIGLEGLSRASRDLGDLLRQSPAALSVGTQSRTPIVHDPRIRGSRVGSLSASGSHWLPARADLDTILSKFDSRQVEQVEIIPGPFTSLLGSGFDFTDIRMLRSPRYDNGRQIHGNSDIDYRANGNQFFGQQSVITGSRDWGAHFNYGVRTGDDYSAGNGQRFASSYESQEMTFALGKDWRDQSIEFSLLRLDQNDVEFPGYVFDIDDLVTDGYQVTHQWRDVTIFDSIETQAWYNRTHFDGTSLNPAKQNFFPVLDITNYVGRTDVDSLSTGYRQSFLLGESHEYRLTIGHDMRYIEQELNEVSSGFSFGAFLPFANRNSPIPKSFSANPGAFLELEHTAPYDSLLRIGGRVDYTHADINDDPAKLQSVGLQPASYSDIVGTSDYSRDFQLLSAFATLRSQADRWNQSVSCGFAERAPNLTELYAAQPFMLLLQNGLNNITGDPALKTEKLFQFDISLEYHGERVRAGARGFQSWAFDYITFENTNAIAVPPVGDIGQVSLRYVNTDFATLTGFECFSELLPNSCVTPFLNFRYVQGTDRTRDGNFATTNGSQGNPSRKVAGLPRGFFSGIDGGATEPLPSISPLETRTGFRFQDTSDARRWLIELTSRIVDNQSRVASSLLESPTPGFTTWDIRAVLHPSSLKGLVVVTGIENFTDKAYREHLDFRNQSGSSLFQPGLTFYAGTSISY